MSQPLLSAEDLVVGYTTAVLGPLSFTLSPGEVLGLAGPNGCGKSTLLRAIAKPEHIFNGTLKTAPELVLGWQLQQPVKLEEMPLNGHDYLRYARSHRTPPARLATWLDQRLDRLSGGQFQLLALWATLGGSADLILLDEPTNNLDPQSIQLLTQMLTERQPTQAILLVSHEQRFLQETCSRIIEIAQ